MHTLISGTTKQVKSKIMGVILDFEFNLYSHINKITKVVFYPLRNIACWTIYLTMQDGKTLICAFVFSQMNYSGSLYRLQQPGF